MEPNFFELFGLPVSFCMDRQLLLTKMLELQKSTHPDKSSSENATEQSAIINIAYKTLDNPIARAKYILLLHGLSVEDSAVPQRMLLEVLQWREQLEEANDAESLSALHGEITKLEYDEMESLAAAFESKQYEKAMESYVTLLFIKRFVTELESKLYTRFA